MLQRLLTLVVTAAALALPASAHAGPFTWSSAVNIDGATALTGISCPSLTLCVASDNAATSNILTSTDPTGGAGAWTADPVGAGAFQTINAVSCPSTSLCVAVDSAGFVYWSTDPAGSLWSDTGASVNGGSTLTAISCPSVSLCVAGGLNGIVWSTSPTAGAGAWTQAAIDPGQQLGSISCPTITLCVAGDDAGDKLTSTNPTGGVLQWSSAHVSSGVIVAMSCPSTGLCVAGDDSGNVITTSNPTGGALGWRSANVAGFAFVNAVACAPGTTTCVAVDSAARAFDTTNPTGGVAAWTSTNLASQMQAIGCPSALLCATVGNSGNAFFGIQRQLTVSLAGSGSGSVGGSGIACTPGCTGVYPVGTVVNLTAAPATGSTFAGWGGDCTGTGTCTVTMSADRSVAATFEPTPSAGPAIDQTPPPGGQTPAPLPPPVVARSANAIPIQPGVRIKAVGKTAFVPLSSPEQLQFGAIIDARKGRVRLVIANGKGGTDSADFYQGVFRLTQRRAAVPIAELTLVGGSFRRCSRTRTASAARTKGKSVRHLWGSGSGAFRTKGRYASATIRGTRWLTDDRCGGTLVRVAQGSVTVRDVPRRKSLVVRAPRSYFAGA